MEQGIPIRSSMWQSADVDADGMTARGMQCHLETPSALRARGITKTYDKVCRLACLRIAPRRPTQHEAYQDMSRPWAFGKSVTLVTQRKTEATNQDDPRLEHP